MAVKDLHHGVVALARFVNPPDWHVEDDKFINRQRDVQQALLFRHRQHIAVVFVGVAQTHRQFVGRVNPQFDIGQASVAGNTYGPFRVDVERLSGLLADDVGVYRSLRHKAVNRLKDSIVNYKVKRFAFELSIQQVNRQWVAFHFSLNCAHCTLWVCKVTTNS